VTSALMVPLETIVLHLAVRCVLMTVIEGSVPLARSKRINRRPLDISHKGPAGEAII
jgi:hypothetical protein